MRISVNNGRHNVISGFCSEGNFFGDFEYYKKSTRLGVYQAYMNCNLVSIRNNVINSAVVESFTAGRKFHDTLKRRFEAFQDVIRMKSRELTMTERLHHRNNFIRHHSDTAKDHQHYQHCNESIREKIWIDGDIAPSMTAEESFQDNSSHKSNVILFRVVKLDAQKRKILVEENMKSLGDRLIFHPRGYWKTNWDLLIGVLIIYSVLFIPVQIGFSWYEDGGLPIFENIVDALFFADIIFCFRLAYYSDEDDAIVTVLSSIAKKYANSWLLIDICSSLPFDTILSTVFGNARSFSSIQLLKVVRLTRLLKLARLLKLSKYTNDIEELLGLPPALYDLLKMILEVLFIGHLLACAWWGLCLSVSKEAWFDDPTGILYGSLRQAPIGMYVVILI